MHGAVISVTAPREPYPLRRRTISGLRVARFHCFASTPPSARSDRSRATSPGQLPQSVLPLYSATRLGDPVADEVFRALRNNPDGITHTDVRDLVGRHGNSYQIDRALRALAELGRARCVKEDTGGRPAERWFAIAT